jgi:hypothetical protein
MTTLTHDPQASCSTPAVPCAPSQLFALGEDAERRVFEWDTRLSVVEGVVYLEAGDDERPMTPGDAAVLRAGEPARYFNAGDLDAVLVRCSCIPA